MTKMLVIRHLVSFCSFLFITVNLLIGFAFLLLTLILLPFSITRGFASRMVDKIYRFAVIVDAWWFVHVLRINFRVDDKMDVLQGLSSSESVIVICNHQSWFDIFVLQTLICRRGPILRFPIKVELLWVPVLGWIAVALNFPRLKRKSDPESRRQDLAAVESASVRLGSECGALMIFPEGTRFSDQKHLHKKSGFQRLLPPKPGGMTAIKNSMPDKTPIMDVTIRYKRGEINCWRFMSGLADSVDVTMTRFVMKDINDVAIWLNQRWTEKDAWLKQGQE